MAITGNLNWNNPRIITSFLQGEDAELIYAQTEGIRTGHIQYDPQTKLVTGSTPFLAARVDSIVRPLGLRVASLRDLSQPEVMQMIQGKFYSDTPALVARSETDKNYSRNNTILQFLAEQASQKHEKYPFMVTGFDVAPDPEDTQGYGIKLIPREDFKLTYDERLEGKYNEKNFSEVDEQGFPVFDKNGTRTWYARGSGLSWLCLDSGLGLDSGYVILDLSVGMGRVVLISGEATSQNFEQYLTKLRQEADAKKTAIDARFEKARKILLNEE